MVPAAIRRAGYRSPDLIAGRRAPFQSAQEDAVRLGRLLAALVPLRKHRRLEEVAQPISSAEHEEVYYWFSKVTTGPEQGRGRREKLLDLRDLGDGTMAGLSSEVGYALAGRADGNHPLSWELPDEQARHTWRNEIDATEDGTEGVAIVLDRQLGYTVTSRSRHGTGFDCWLGRQADGNPIQDEVCMEVSCAVERHHFSAGANPARQLSFRPVAIGAGHGGNDMV